VGRNFIVTNSVSANIGSKKRTVGRKVFIGPKAARFIAVIIFSSLGLLYLTQSTQGADRSYKLRDLSDQKTQLTEQKDRLKIEESRLESLNEIDKNLSAEATEAEKMQSTNQVEYLSTNQ
jgi:hypothetical protein